MMKNKLLVIVQIPQIDEELDIYIPLNKNIATIINLISKSINENKDSNYLDYTKLSLYNSDTGIKYNSETVVRDSTIRHATKLILL